MFGRKLEDPKPIPRKKLCKDRYNSNVKKYIEYIYIGAIIVWFILTVVLGLWKRDDVIVWLILSVPFVVFLINYLGLSEFDCGTEDQMFRGNFLSFGFLVAVILMNWNNSVGQENKIEFFKILTAAFILLMLSLIDLWVCQKKMKVVKHIKTCLHTAASVLLALALYLYYTYQRDYPYEFITKD